MTPYPINIVEKLEQLMLRTDSDLTAIGVVDQHTRKIHWHPVYGSLSSRTDRIRQNVNIGLTGEVLRTGSFQQSKAQKHELFELGESIMLTEKLLHAAAWPFSFGSEQNNAAIIIGKRHEGGYNASQIEAGTALVQELTHLYTEICSSYI